MRILWTSLFCFLVLQAFSQLPLAAVEGLPTKELSDLHVDKKGYLWIAHGLGISRYDGLNFINYTHPSQINLRMTDIVEDVSGRIWCHNLSGQVFYIENGKMHFLEAYDYKKENQTPRMAICGTELLITSYKGLFVLNTGNLTTSFHSFQHIQSTASVSLTVNKTRALLFNNNDWYIYEKNRLQKIQASPSLRLPPENFIQLQPAMYNDTIYLTANPSGILYKLKLYGNELKLITRQPYHDYINTVSVDQEAWIHTRNNSFDLTSPAAIKNYDLTDVVIGHEGNTWYSSRREGLLVSYRPSLWTKMNFKIDTSDYIRALNANAGYFFAGTQKGTLYAFESDITTPEWKHELFNGLGSIDFIRHIRSDQFIVGSSTSTYIVDVKQKKIIDSLPIKAIFDVGIDSSSLYLATPMGVYVVPYLKHSRNNIREWLQVKKQQYPFFNWEENISYTYLLFPQRTLSIRFDSLQQQVYAATKNGLFEVSKKGIFPYFINNKAVYATSVSYKKGALYVSTINNGLWIIEKNNLQHFTTANSLASNTIIRVKVTEDHLWIFEKEGIQVIDIHTRQLLQNIDMPNVEGSNVMDVAEKGEFAYLTTASGIYKIPLNIIASKINPSGFLDYVIVNDNDTLPGNNTNLRHYKNNLQFYFSSPSFYNAAGVSFRYRLKGVEESWRATEPGERMIRYSSLPAGNYVFELYAINSDGMRQQNTLSYSFSIGKPWWSTWWFYVLIYLAIMAVVYLLFRNRIDQRLKLELMRSNISRDLHDDIGATLSSLNFYLDLVTTEEDKTVYLQQIRQNVNHVVNSLDDLIWSINPKNDTTEQFLTRMREYAVPLLKVAHIKCHFECDQRLFKAKMTLETKRQLYLLFKEMINNVMKHSRSENCYIRLEYHHGRLHLSVSDDGLGFDMAKLKKNRNGLSNMRERTKRLNGEIEISSAEQQGSRLEVKIPV